MNRISHPDWVKICVDPNGRIKLRTKQKDEILSATRVCFEETVKVSMGGEITWLKEERMCML